MKVVAVVVSAGLGKRLNKKIPKPLIALNGKPILIHTLENLSHVKLISEIILVVNKNYLNAFRKKIRQFGLGKVKKIVIGGKTRGKSVFKGLKAIEGNCDVVLIHDAVRPFVEENLVKKIISASFKYGAAILAVPLKPTIKKVDLKRKEIVETVERENLWEAQTPQAFKKYLILNAYKKIRDFNFTDDASLLEKMGKKVKIVSGSYKNIKITTPEDLEFAKVILKDGK